MQFPGQGKPSLGIVFDADFGRGIDEALAYALIHGFEGKNDARLISTSTTRSSLKSAAFADTLQRFLAGPPPPPSPSGFTFQRPVPPIGMPEGGKAPGDLAVLAAVLDKRTPEGKPVYPHHVELFNDTADPSALIRNALTAQYDGNCVVVLAGPATNLANVLDLPGTIDLIRSKVKFLAMAVGSYPQGGPDSSVRADIASAKKLLAQWPTPIVAAGAEVGEALPFPGASLKTKFAWAPDHPIVDAYRAFRKMPYDAAAPALAAVLYAVHPEGYFKLSEPGAIGILDDGRVRFTPAPEGRQRYLVVDPAEREKVTQTYVDLVSAKPVPRQRFRRSEKKDAVAAPDPAKKP